jgi:hypothetical protein
MPEEEEERISESSRTIPFDLVQSIVRLLEPYSAEDQRHVIETVSKWLRLEDAAAKSLNTGVGFGFSDRAPVAAPKEDYKFSGRPEVSPKEFLLEKQPNTEVERVACLAYYLTHFREQQYFTTDDLRRLNMDAAQRVFSNASYTAKNAVRDGFLVPAPKKGARQLSALGEQYVQALPDHEAAHQLRKRMFRKRAGSRGRRNAGGQVVDAEE